MGPSVARQVLIAAGLQRLVRVRHEVGAALAEHHLQIRGLEAHVDEAVEDVGGRGDAVPRAEHRLRAVPRPVLEEDQDLAAQDEEHFLHLVGVGGIALAGRDEHHAEREVLGGDHARIRLAGGAAADEPVLGAAVALDARVREGIPVPLAIGEARHLPGQELIERLCHSDSSRFLRTIRPGCLPPGSPVYSNFFLDG